MLGYSSAFVVGALPLVGVNPQAPQDNATYLDLTFPPHSTPLA